MDARTSHPNLALRAARKQGNTRDLVLALSDDDPGVRDTAARFLGLLGDVRAVEPLLRRLDPGEDDGHRILVAKALGKIGDTRAVPPLYSLASDSDSWGLLRIAAMDALARLGDRRSLVMIAEALVDPASVYAYPIHKSSDRVTRRWAAKRLAECNASEVIDRLERAAGDARGRDRRRLRRVIRKLVKGRGQERSR